MLFVIFALVVAIATGIPFLKKNLEDKKTLKKYMGEEGLGKNEALGKIKDDKTFNDKVIEGLFYLSLVALVFGGFYNFYSSENNSNPDKIKAQQQPENTMSEITTDQNKNNEQQGQQQNVPVVENNIITGNPANDVRIQDRVKKEQDRINKMFTDSEKNTKSLLDALRKSVQEKDTNSGIKNGEKALESVKKSNDLFKNAKCVTTGDPTFDKECPKLLEEGKKLYSSKQIDVEKMLEVLKSIEKGVKDIQSSDLGQQAIQEGSKLWDELMKKVDDSKKK